MTGKATTCDVSGSATPGFVAIGETGPVLDKAAVVVVVVATAAATAGLVAGMHESASAGEPPLNASAEIPTVRTMTTPVTRHIPRRCRISRPTVPVAMRRIARGTNIERLAPVTGRPQATSHATTRYRPGPKG